jgi:hypothetical protein
MFSVYFRRWPNRENTNTQNSSVCDRSVTFWQKASAHLSMKLGWPAQRVNNRRGLLDCVADRFRCCAALPGWSGEECRNGSDLDDGDDQSGRPVVTVGGLQNEVPDAACH